MDAVPSPLEDNYLTLRNGIIGSLVVDRIAVITKVEVQRSYLERRSTALG